MPQKATRKAGGVYQYLLNRQDWKTEDDWLAAQVFRTAENWLRDNVEESQPFYLHIESFSPHEFWDPPESFYRMYMKKDYRGPILIHPPQSTAKMSPLEVEHARAMYAGLVTFTDSRIGKFLQTVEQLGLMKNTVIVFVADHGTMMGEQGQLHKGEQRLRVQCTNVPLSIYHPRENWAGRKIGGYVSHADLMPTILDMAGVQAPTRVTGESLRPIIAAGARSKREWAITGWGEHASIRTPEWNYHARWSEGPGFEELYDLGKDPLELKSVAAAHPHACERFRKRLQEYVAAGWAVTKGHFHLEVS
jgi:arylsulfatase A-like enzyme